MMAQLDGITRVAGIRSHIDRQAGRAPANFNLNKQINYIIYHFDESYKDYRVNYKCILSESDQFHSEFDIKDYCPLASN